MSSKKPYSTRTRSAPGAAWVLRKVSKGAMTRRRRASNSATAASSAAVHLRLYPSGCQFHAASRLHWLPRSSQRRT